MFLKHQLRPRIESHAPSPRRLGYLLYIRDRNSNALMRATGLENPVYLESMTLRINNNSRQGHFVQPALLALALPALSQRASRLEEFQRQYGIISKRTSRLVIKYLLKRGIVQVSRCGYSFSKADRIKLALLTIQSGNDIERISNCLSWQDFEAFASNLLNISGYVTECNLHFSKPSRVQIDVVGINHHSGLAIVIDCKHWKRNPLSSISLFARKQAQGTSELLREGIQIKCVFSEVLFQARRMCSNSQTLRDFFVVPNADLLTRKNIVVGSVKLSLSR